jgi:hypothetical protein
MWTLLMVLALAVAAGCSEEPQHLAASAERGFSTDAWDDQLRERTLRQGESRRIYH